MTEFVAIHIYDYVGQPPYIAATKIMKHFEEKYKTQAVQGHLTVGQLKGLVRNTRQGEAAGDLKFHVPPLSTLSPTDGRDFFQFDIKINLEGGEGGYNRMIGWAHPALIKLFAHGNRPVFVDGTFYCVPKPFSQLIVVIQYSKAHDLYVPTWFILLDGKCELIYRQMLFAIKMVHLRYDSPFTATTATCDFEAALQNALKEALEKDDLEGCLFHFKQAVRRHMIKVLKFKTEVATAMMELINVLTVVHPDEIWSKGVPYILSKVDVSESPEKWALFVAYIGKTWLTYYSALDWNVHRFLGQQRSAKFDDPMVNRTNNPCENFNGRLGRRFSAENGHPSQENFVCTIKQMSCETVDRMRRIEEEKEDKQHHPQVQFAPLPADYDAYIPPTELTIGRRVFHFDKPPNARAQRVVPQHQPLPPAPLSPVPRLPVPVPAHPVPVPADPVPAPADPVPAPAGPVPAPVDPVPVPVPRVRGKKKALASLHAPVAVAVVPPVLPVPPLLPAYPDLAPASPGFHVPFIQFNPDESDEEPEEPVPVPQPSHVLKVVQWIQCEACNKWRTVPDHVDVKLLEAAPWYCRQNSWNKALAKCNAAEEPYDE